MQDAWFHIAFQDEWWVDARGWAAWKETLDMSRVPDSGKHRIMEMSGARAWRALAHLHGKLWALPLVIDDFEDGVWPARVARPVWDETPSWEETVSAIAQFPCAEALHLRAEQLMPWPREWWEQWLSEALVMAEASNDEDVRRRVDMFERLAGVEGWGEVLHSLPRLAKIRLRWLGPSVLDTLLADGILPHDALSVASALTS